MRARDDIIQSSETVRRSAFILALAIALTPMGCDGERGEVTTAATGEVEGTSTGAVEAIEEHGLRLEVVSSLETGAVGEVLASADKRLVILEVQLANLERERPVSVAYPFFTLRSEGGVEFLGSDQTEFLDSGCDATALVAAGGSYDCALAFEIPLAHAAAALVYRPDPHIELVVPFESEPCTPCGEACVDISRDPAHCGGCRQAVGPTKTCIGGVGVCVDELTRCGSSCVDLDTNPAFCGSCDVNLPGNQLCENGAPACPSDAPTLCGSSCTYLETDPDNCGECGNKVPTCKNGRPWCGNDTTWCPEFSYCRNLRNDPMHCGECGNACSADAICGNATCS
ncbi:MAG: hypothetical protein JKY37_15890 [Nannocystaceae bacterium]|nr:hypothetical protein [Nannocystaceae bacterium]